MDLTALLIFVLVYAGMMLGGYPGLMLDRTGIALLGAILCVGFNKIDLESAWLSVDVSTMALLLGLMVVSAQFRLAGFYTRVTEGIAGSDHAAPVLLATLIAIAGLFSAILANDIVCLAMTPVLIEACARRSLNPLPFLLALACAANIGSAATLIGNPQNMLIGESLDLSFAGYLLDALVPSVIGLAITWAIIARFYRGRWSHAFSAPPLKRAPFNAWQTVKGLVLIAVLMALFLVGPFPRDHVALAAAGILLMSRRMASRELLGLVDWHLLVLFAGLFVVNETVRSSGVLEVMLQGLHAAHVHLEQPVWLFIVTAVLSNLVSNVPAAMLLLHTATHPLSGAILALASTLAGNLLIVGSIANIIVVEQAALMGVRIGWREHARIGIPVTVATLAVAAAWLWLRAAW